MSLKMKKRITAIGAFSSGVTGGTLGVFKQWAANLSPTFDWLLGGVLAALVGALVFSVLERRYVRPLDVPEGERSE